MTVKLKSRFVCGLLLSLTVEAVQPQVATSTQPSNERSLYQVSPKQPKATTMAPRNASRSKVDSKDRLEANTNQVDETTRVRTVSDSTNGRESRYETVPPVWSPPPILSGLGLQTCLKNSQSSSGFLGPFKFSNPRLPSNETTCQKAAFALRSDGVNLDPIFAFSASNGIVYGTWKEWEQGVYFPVARILDAWISGLDENWGIEKGNFKGSEISLRSRSEDFSIGQFFAKGRGDGLVFDPKRGEVMHAVWYDAPVLLMEGGKRPVSGLISIYVRSKGSGDNLSPSDGIQAARTIFESLNLNEPESRRLSVVDYKRAAPRIKPDEQQFAGGPPLSAPTVSLPRSSTTSTSEAILSGSKGTQPEGSFDLYNHILKLSYGTPSSAEMNFSQSCNVVYTRIKIAVAGFDLTDPSLRAAKLLCDDLMQWEIIQHASSDKSDAGVYRYLLGSYAAAIRMQRLWNGSDVVRTVLTDFRAYVARLYAARGKANPFEKPEIPPASFDFWFHAPSEQFMVRYGKGTDWEMWVTKDPVCVRKDGLSPIQLRKLGFPSGLKWRVHNEEKALAKKLESSSTLNSDCAFFILG